MNASGPGWVIGTGMAVMRLLSKVKKMLALVEAVFLKYKSRLVGEPLPWTLSETVVAGPPIQHDSYKKRCGHCGVGL